jgi:hypothetical protein
MPRHRHRRARRTETSSGFLDRRAFFRWPLKPCDVSLDFGASAIEYFQSRRYAMHSAHAMVKPAEQERRDLSSRRGWHLCAQHALSFHACLRGSVAEKENGLRHYVSSRNRSEASEDRWGRRRIVSRRNSMAESIRVPPERTRAFRRVTGIRENRRRVCPRFRQHSCWQAISSSRLGVSMPIVAGSSNWRRADSHVHFTRSRQARTIATSPFCRGAADDRVDRPSRRSCPGELPALRCISLSPSRRRPACVG